MKICEHNEKTMWQGFKTPMGTFLVVKDGKTAIGKCDPLTKEVLEWYELDFDGENGK